MRGWKSTPELSERIASKFNEIVSEGARCSLCTGSEFVVAEGLTPIELTSNEMSVGGRRMPCAVLVCKKCGAVFLLNLIVLGLADADGDEI